LPAIKSPARSRTGTVTKPRKRAAWTVYILRCADSTLYTGIAKDAVKRVAEHNTNNRLGARYTRSRRPVAMVYAEPAPTRSAASRREHAIKALTRAEKETLIEKAPRRGRRRAA
jgi:putative endonuclease